MRREAIQTSGKPKDWLRGYRDFERLGGMPAHEQIKDVQDLTQKWFEHLDNVLVCIGSHINGLVHYSPQKIDELFGAQKNAQSMVDYWTGWLCRVSNEMIYAQASMHDWLSDPRNAQHRPDDWTP